MKVSIVIPTYNRADLLVETLDSVLAQTVPPGEIIVVDDGSSDSTSERIRAFKEPITYVYQENNGRSSARNRGLALASGDYVMFLDSDDILVPGAIESLRNLALRSSDAGIVGGGRVFVDDRMNELDIGISQAPASSFTSRNLGVDCIRQVFFPPSTYMVRREVAERLGGFRKTMEPAEDLDFFVRACATTKVSYDANVIVKMRRHAGNTDDTDLRRASIRIANERLQDQARTLSALEKKAWLLRKADDHYALGDFRSLPNYVRALAAPGDLGGGETARTLLQAVKSLVPGSLRRRYKLGNAS
jgi:glycosyltransferase involved in cell wall biosynthesis